MTIIRNALEDPRVVRLMTIPGIGPIVASTVLASIGDVSRFETPEKFVLLRTDAEGSPVRQSPCASRTDQRAGKHARAQDARRGGVVSEDGTRSARAFSDISNAMGRLPRRPSQPQKTGGDDLVRSEGRDRIACARPAFTAMKLRKAALKAGTPREYGKAGPGRDYWIKEIREQKPARSACRAGLRADGGGVEGKAPQGSGQGHCA